jgi:hypothetical protein
MKTIVLSFKNFCELCERVVNLFLFRSNIFYLDFMYKSIMNNVISQFETKCLTKFMFHFFFWNFAVTERKITFSEKVIYKL